MIDFLLTTVREGSEGGKDAGHGPLVSYHFPLLSLFDPQHPTGTKGAPCPRMRNRT